VLSALEQLYRVRVRVRVRIRVRVRVNYNNDVLALTPKSNPCSNP
jgi:hypothetical protein